MLRNLQKFLATHCTNTNYIVRSKENIERYYVAVGLLEEFEKSIQLFEHALPEYFEGASNILS